MRSEQNHRDDERDDGDSPVTSSRPLSSEGPVERALLDRAAPRVQVHRRMVSAGVTVRWLESGPERAGGSSPSSDAVVLLHGRGHAASVWLPLMSLLAPHLRVLAIDLPGFGQSTPPCVVAPGAPGPSWPSGADAALAAFAQPVGLLLEQLGVERVALAGHSLGALVSLALAHRGRAQGGAARVAVTRLALIGAMGLDPAMTLGARLFFRAGPERLARRLPPSLFARLTGGDRAQSSEAQREQAALEHELVAGHGLRPEASAAFNALFGALGGAVDRLAWLEEAAVPTLLLWGDHDEVVPARIARRVASRCPQVETRLFAAGHAPHLEQPEAVLPGLGAFLTGSA